ncbi:MAG: hypothetical protein WA672_09845, partial [Candidatus Angelobacter sp.]
MTASGTASPRDRADNRITKGIRDRQFFSTPRVEDWQHLARMMVLLSTRFHRQHSLQAMEQNGVFKYGALALGLEFQLVPGNKKFTGLLATKRVEAYQFRRSDNSMKSIAPYCVDAAEPRQSLAACIDKSAIRADVAGGPAAFAAPEDVQLCQRPILNRDGRIAIDAGLPQRSQSQRGQSNT